MKAAILADILGKSIALNKVLDDIRFFGGVDEYWLLGDFAAIGHDPVHLVEWLTALPNTRAIR